MAELNTAGRILIQGRASLKFLNDELPEVEKLSKK